MNLIACRPDGLQAVRLYIFKGGKIWRHIPSSAGHHRPKQNLVKDPNLVSTLAGHVEGSRAFSRYRDIDIDMKRDLVKILEGKQ